MNLLVLNAGSSSLKAMVLREGGPVLAASVSEIGGQAVLRLGDQVEMVAAQDHSAAVGLLLAALAGQGFALGTMQAVAHRVVHGGPWLTNAMRVTAGVLAQIEACVPLAPLHNPANLAAIRAVQAFAPDLPQTVHFDTAFHATNPAVAVTYALPQAERDRGLRRYGFHGLSYASLVAQLSEPRPERLLALHLGNGASLCAIHQGRSVATTMGWSPLDGLTMGTRAGAMDGNAVLDMAARHGVDGAAHILNRESGLRALGGHSDMRVLHQAGTAEATFAIEHFCYWAVRHAGSMAAAMGGLDAIAFTGGIGENDAVVRAKILQGLEFLGVRFDTAANATHQPGLHESGASVAVWIVPAAEEAYIAGEALRLMEEVG